MGQTPRRDDPTGRLYRYVCDSDSRELYCPRFYLSGGTGFQPPFSRRQACGGHRQVSALSSAGSGFTTRTIEKIVGVGHTNPKGLGRIKPAI